MLDVEKRCVELADTGEFLTSDDVLEQLRKADAERTSKKAKKTSGITKKSSRTKKSESDSIDTTRCGKCGQVYTDDKAEDWIGCDRCESWWYSWCVPDARSLEYKATAYRSSFFHQINLYLCLKTATLITWNHFSCKTDY